MACLLFPKKSPFLGEMGNLLSEDPLILVPHLLHMCVILFN